MLHHLKLVTSMLHVVQFGGAVRTQFMIQEQAYISDSDSSWSV